MLTCSMASSRFSELVASSTKSTTADKATATDKAVETTIINVNKADLKTLQTLPGISAVLAQRIIDGRPYKTLDDLGKVKGLGDMPNKSYPWGVNVFRQRLTGGEEEGYALSPTGTGGFLTRGYDQG